MSQFFSAFTQFFRYRAAQAGYRLDGTCCEGIDNVIAPHGERGLGNNGRTPLHGQVVDKLYNGTNGHVCNLSTACL